MTTSTTTTSWITMMMRTNWKVSTLKGIIIPTVKTVEVNFTFVYVDKRRKYTCKDFGLKSIPYGEGDETEAHACNCSLYYRNWHEPTLSTLYTTWRKHCVFSKPTNDWGLLRPRLHEVRAIYRAHGIEFALYYGCHILQCASVRSNSCLRWYLFSHPKGSQPWPITTCATHTISVTPGLDACSLWPGTVGWALGRVSAHKRSVCRVSAANRTRIRTHVR